MRAALEHGRDRRLANLPHRLPHRRQRHRQPRGVLDVVHAGQADVAWNRASEGQQRVHQLRGAAVVRTHDGVRRMRVQVRRQRGAIGWRGNRQMRQ